MKKIWIILLLVLISLSGCVFSSLTLEEEVEGPLYVASLEAVKASMPNRVVISGPPDCTVCHIEKSDYSSPFYYLPLNFSHKSHTNLGMACLFCHRAASSSKDIDDDLMPAGHFYKTKKGRKGPDKNPCRACHLYSSESGKKDQKLPARCDTCHRGYPNRKVKLRRGNYMAGLLNNHEVHFKKGITCLRCHVDFDKLENTVNKFTPTRMFCQECHVDGVVARNPDTLAPPPSGTKALFMRDCSPCHGEDGKGEGKVAGFFEANLRPRDLTDAATMGKRSDEELFKVIYKGGPELRLSERMPAWQGLLTVEEVMALVKYVRGLSANDK